MDSVSGKQETSHKPQDSLQITESCQPDSGDFVMPSVLELVEERAHLQELDRELQALHTLPELESPTSQHPSTNKGDQRINSVHALLHTLSPHLPHHDFIKTFLESTEHLDDVGKIRVTKQVVSSVCSMLHSEESSWSEEEVVCVGAWLCVQSVAADTRALRRHAARALCCLLDNCATDQQIERLGHVVCSAGWEPETLIDVSDAASGATQPALSTALRRAAVRGGELCVRGLTRLVPALPDPARAPLRAALHAHAHARPHAHSRTRLKLMVDLSMLQLFLSSGKESTVSK